MYIAIAIQAVLALLGCYVAWQAAGFARICQNYAHGAEGVALKLRGERDRVSVAEREIAALRRELRSLSSKYYADKRELPSDGRELVPATNHPDYCHEHGDHLRGSPACDLALAREKCENYEVAQKEGPNSKAAQCVCSYCLGRRAAKAAFRDAAVPKTAQAQGELARLNGSKP